MKQLIDSGKQWQLSSFWAWIQSWFSVASTNECSKCYCGKTNLNFVIGGIKTGVNKYPWMAILLHDNKFKCGASLINDRYVLTLATYVDEYNKQGTIKNLTVRLLEHDRSMDTETTLIDRQVQSILLHSSFADKRNVEGDIALVKFTEPVKLIGILRPVCLPTPGFNYSGIDGVVTGWGTQYYK